MTESTAEALKTIFVVRRSIARLGETDWMHWWESHALTDPGAYVVKRLFPRTPELSAAHISFLAARRRHDGSVPNEPLVHLFNFGEVFEGAFERWLMDAKAQRWKPEPLTAQPSTDLKEETSKALEAAGITPENLGQRTGAFAIGDVIARTLTDVRKIESLAGRLAAAYSSSEPGKLYVPFYRTED
ncbi:BrxE family protein [Gemmatimonadota bacterium]